MKRSLIILLSACIFSCNSGYKGNLETATNEMAADTMASAYDAPKIVKTADLNFRVKDVQSTKIAIGKLLATIGGQITEVAINNEVMESRKFKYSADSLKEVTAYRTQGNLVVRVPSSQLDLFTNDVAKMAVLLHSQSLKLDDKRIAYLSNKLKSSIRGEAAKQVAKNNKKTSDVKATVGLQDDLIDRKLENLVIDSQVAFSEVTLSFYQDNAIKSIIVPNDNLSSYNIDFFKQLKLNIIEGWYMLSGLILFFTKLWAVFALGFVVWLIVSFFIRKKRIKSTI